MDETRLAELKRQRELVRQHLQWLEALIAAEDDQPLSPQKAPAPTPAPPASNTQASGAAEEHDDSYIIHHDMAQTQELVSSWRTGCILLLALTILVMVSVFFWPLPQLIYR